MADTLTPMMQQYQRIRASLPPDVLLLFRLGDFYEMFFDDAKEASGILNVALTKRNQTPMCGVPYHAAEGYVAKLIKAGKRVAICDQVSEPQPGRIVQREVTQIITAGTVNDLNQLESKRNNYLAALFVEGGVHGFAFADLSTGEFRLTELSEASALMDELARVQPVEILISEDQQKAFSELEGVVSTDGYAFLYDHASFTLREHLKVQSLDGYGCTGLRRAVGAAGAIIHYLKNQLRRNVEHINSLSVYSAGSYLVLDAVSQANLELVSARGPGGVSLLEALDRTITPMGARKLRYWTLHPLREIEPLTQRQEVIAALLHEPFLLSQCREALKGIRDIERTVGRLSQGSGNGRDLLALRNSLEKLPDLKEHVQALTDRQNFGLEAGRRAASLGAQMQQKITAQPELLERLHSALADDPPHTIKEGGIFREGWDPTLDELRAASRSGKDWIAELQQREIERTGIKSLKIRFNAVFGYFIEITKSNLAHVPDTYTRKQTTVNSERFITPELKEVEGKILGADERSRGLEHDLFLRLRNEVLQHLAELQATADAIAELDVLGSLAETARLYGYCRPVLGASGRIRICDGRHPVLDQNLVEEKFVPNDVELDREVNRLILITGPNMAGKSTYIRQVALLVLMAQIGSFIPAREAEIGLVDRIFTRVGANDDLARGQSTFMVEMNETANILNNASPDSLVILDEIGRGTSTFDGLSLAWSIAEHLHDEVKALALFATHYHELTELEVTRPAVKNYNVAVREWNEQIIFLRKIIKGSADKSYGIHVARLAGMPATVLQRARTILANLEEAELNAQGKPRLAEAHRARARKAAAEGSDAARPQLSFLEQLQ